MVLGLAVPWYLWAGARTGGEFYRQFFWYHNIERGLHGTLVAHPWWFYGPRLCLDFLPWSLLLPVAAWLYVRRPSARDDRHFFPMHRMPSDRGFDDAALLFQMAGDEREVKFRDGAAGELA